MKYNPILAGILIGIGGIVNLKIGGVAGAIFFSVGLLTILHFSLSLFTGKVGLLATKEISVGKVIYIWLCNFIGATLIGGLYGIATNNCENAVHIVATRIANGFWTNLFLGVLCGILMYAAVTGYKQTKNAVFVIMPVAAFILGGFNHCIADMFYLGVGGTQFSDWLILIPTTIGNIIGCNLIPIIKKLSGD